MVNVNNLKPEILYANSSVSNSFTQRNNLKLARDRIDTPLKVSRALEPAASDLSIKVIDFGSSCYQSERTYTYVQSRFYRSPEVILGIEYTTAVDMWSLGCILCELITGQPLFPGETEQEQLACIMEVMGIPPPSVLKCSSRADLFFCEWLF